MTEERKKMFEHVAKLLKEGKITIRQAPDELAKLEYDMEMLWLPKRPKEKA